MSAGHTGVALLVIADIGVGFAVLASWASYLNPVLTMLVSICALAYYLREYIKPLCKWLMKKKRKDE